MNPSSEKKTNLILYVLLGSAFLGLAVFGWLYVSKMMDPVKRAELEVRNEGGTRYTLMLKKGQAGEDDPEGVARALRSRLKTWELDHVSVVVTDGGELVVTVPDSVGSVDQRVFLAAGHLSFHMAHPDHQLYRAGDKPIVPGAEMFPYRGDPSRTMLVQKKSEFDGSELKRARVTNQVGSWQILLSLKKTGAAKFYDLSKANNTAALGAGALPFAIILDGEIYSAPVFNEPIAGGTAVISGDFTEAEVRLLTTMMMTPLPAEIELVSEEKIPPAK